MNAPDLGRSVGGLDRWWTKWTYDNVSSPAVNCLFVTPILFSSIMQKSRNLNAFNQRQYWRGNSGLSLCVLQSRNTRMSRLLFFLPLRSWVLSVRYDRFLDYGCDDAVLYASVASMSWLLSISVSREKDALREYAQRARCLSRTSRQKCDFGDIMRYTLATSRWHVCHRYAKLGKYVR